MALESSLAVYTDLMQKPRFILAEWDEEAADWVATSDDVPGLATESDTLEALAEKLKHLVPELLEANGEALEGEVAFEIMARRYGVASRALH